jgi:ferredoxin--NADP+ reductase
MPKKFQILRKRILTPEISAISVYAPLIAAKARAGQFIILRANGEGERIPLTISSHEGDGVTVVFQKAGASTLELDQLQEGDCLADFAGPLGQPTPIARHGRVAVVGGGLGCAIALPVAQALKEAGNTVDLIGGFKTRHLIILEEELRAASNTLYLCTDDGSFGYGGFVTDQLKELMVNGATYGHIFAIGPLIMMKAVTRAAQSAGIPVTVSMSPLMIDGTGMCGCCRVTVGGQIRFACVDGPDFDGTQVDFDEAIARNRSYQSFENRQRKEHLCRLTGGVRHG